MLLSCRAAAYGDCVWTSCAEVIVWMNLAFMTEAMEKKKIKLYECDSVFSVC